MKILETERLILRWADERDAELIFRLVNEPSWLRFIGNRNVHSLDDAREFIAKRLVGAYERLGFGFYLTELKDSGTKIGICGLVKRDSLDDVDVGFAFLPEFWGKGYAIESASAVMAHGKSALGLNRIVAITNPDNHASIKVLEKLGLRFEKMVTLPGESEAIKLFAPPPAD